MADLGKATKVSAVLAASSLLLWYGFCGPLANAFDPQNGYSYGPTGPFGTIGVIFFLAGIVLVPVTIILAIAWGIKSIVRRR